MLFRMIRRTLTPRRRYRRGPRSKYYRAPKPRQPLNPATKGVLNGCLIFAVAPIGLGCLVVAAVMIGGFFGGQPVGAGDWVWIGVLLLTAAGAAWLV
jgi:hypothetical protein